MSLSAKLIAGFGLSVVVTAALAAGAIWGAARIEDQFSQFQASVGELRVFEQLITKLHKRHTALTRFVYAGHDDARREAALAGAEVRGLTTSLIETAVAEADAAAARQQQRGGSADVQYAAATQLRRLVEFRELLGQLDAAWWECVERNGKDLKSMAREVFDVGCDRPLKQALLPRLEAMIRLERELVEFHRTSLASTVADVRLGALVAATAALVVAAAAVFLLSRSVEAVRQLGEAEAAASEAKSQFLANMSHEIRTPLNGILGFARLLIDRQGELSQSESAKHLATIHSCGTHLLQLINDVLDLSKVEAGRMEIEIADHAPLPMLAEVVGLLGVRAEAKGISLSWRWDGRTPEKIRTDARRLKQILLNLVGNAVKFTEAGGVEVVARTERRQNHWLLVVEITDTGVGIANAQVEHIFQPFRQADSSSTRAHEGTGLGLSICRRFAQLMGGDVTVSSALGEGSTFRLSVDAGDLERVAWGVSETSSVECAVQKASPLPNIDLSLAGRRVLVVDDGKVNRDLSRLILKRAGAHVLLAEDGAQGLAIASTEHVDAIVMDMQMPVMDGLTATRRLRDLNFDGPIIALTANAMLKDRDECVAAGCSAYLAKPFEATKLLSILLEQFGRQERMQPAVRNVGSSSGKEA